MIGASLNIVQPNLTISLSSSTMHIYSDSGNRLNINYINYALLDQAEKLISEELDVKTIKMLMSDDHEMIDLAIATIERFSIRRLCRAFIQCINNRYSPDAYHELNECICENIIDKIKRKWR